MNVHKRCQKNVANNCGINTKQMAEILSAMGISTQNLAGRRKKVRVSCVIRKLTLYDSLLDREEKEERHTSLLLCIASS